MSLKTRSKSEALELKKELDRRFRYQEVIGEPIEPKEPIKMKEAIENYLKYKKQNFAHATYHNDKQRLRWIYNYIGNKPLKELTVDHIIDYVNYRLNKGVKRSTIRIDLIVWKAMLNFFKKRGDISRNPFELYPIKQQPGRMTYLSLEEIERLKAYENPNKPWLKPFLNLALLTGFRRGELVNLKWQDIHPHFIQVKGKTGRRNFPINNRIREVLDSIDRISEFVFAHTPGATKPIDRDYITRSVRNAFRELGFPNHYTLHTLRHTFASWLALSGHSIQEISVLMGHSTIQMTMVYAHLRPEDCNNLKLPY